MGNLRVVFFSIKLLFFFSLYLIIFSPETLSSFFKKLTAIAFLLYFLKFSTDYTLVYKIKSLCQVMGGLQAFGIIGSSPTLTSICFTPDSPLISLAIKLSILSKFRATILTNKLYLPEVLTK